MKWYRDKKISTKLIIGFVIVAILAAVIGIIGIINIVSIGSADTELYEKRTLGLEYANHADLYYQRIRFNIVKSALASDVSAQENSIAKISAYKDVANENLKNFESRIEDGSDRQNYEDLFQKWNTYLTAVDEIIAFMRNGQDAEVRGLIFGDMQTKANDVQSAFDKLEADVIEDARLTAESNTGLVQTSMILMISIAAAGIIIALLLGIAISRMIGKPLKDMTEAAGKLAVGDVDIDLKLTTKDEIGQLTNAFNKVIEGRKKQVSEVGQIAEGNLTIDVQMKSDKDILNESLQNLVNNMNDLIISIISSAEQVSSGSNLVSDSSMALSQGATEQASSVQQLTASVEEVASQTSINAQNAQNANEAAKLVKANADDGNAQMQNMLKSMEDISDSSANIGKIIKVIDDIAFQTNILALNAAVEAARAGQHGKGFAVVAEEVRTLAAKSAQAARETTDLIEGSMRKVETGTKIAQQTAEALEKIVTEVVRAADLIESIAVASNEQSAAIEQINQGITQISSVVQNNAATAEESAAASEELSTQATHLRELVSTFKVKGGTAMNASKPDLNSAAKKEVNRTAKQAIALEAPKVQLSSGEASFGKY